MVVYFKIVSGGIVSSWYKTSKNAQQTEKGKGKKKILSLRQCVDIINATKDNMMQYILEIVTNSLWENEGVTFDAVSCLAGGINVTSHASFPNWKQLI